MEVGEMGPIAANFFSVKKRRCAALEWGRKVPSKENYEESLLKIEWQEGGKKSMR